MSQEQQQPNPFELTEENIEQFKALTSRVYKSYLIAASAPQPAIELATIHQNNIIIPLLRATHEFLNEVEAMFPTYDPSEIFQFFKDLALQMQYLRESLGIEASLKRAYDGE